ncbi:hypothetical protein P153DRAFT_390710 [Dothidotthia symphoricarpi CBS 119687]|uniref:Uncharacterized protein n=1 Tax=Dothidotthia symphoricarpi CBS 119687 TaxID=1392245 RepID=A0A6A5ZZ55_9PLEO|nr:uncharacterized protein P153DRAFT_390710 [Dothidotthia symphoricarpi CBS 119687]KAF2124163.1 hypothetical protein P153DRAFT_390710 [Dothidotthia symphoricarpi CBS 119687]
MKSFFNMFLAILLGLIAVINAAAVPDTTVNDLASNANETNVTIQELAGPEYSYHGRATAEVWLGQTMTNVGDLVGSNLYGTIWNLINDHCIEPFWYHDRCGYNDAYAIKVNYLRDNGQIGQGK